MVSYFDYCELSTEIECAQVMMIVDYVILLMSGGYTLFDKAYLCYFVRQKHID